MRGLENHLFLEGRLRLFQSKFPYDLSASMNSVEMSRRLPAKGNGELVRKIAEIAKEPEREIATPSEARKIIGLHK